MEETKKIDYQRVYELARRILDELNGIHTYENFDMHYMNMREFVAQHECPARVIGLVEYAISQSMKPEMTVGDFVKMFPSSVVMQFPKVGIKTINDLREAFHAKGIEWF